MSPYFHGIVFGGLIAFALTANAQQLPPARATAQVPQAAGPSQSDGLPYDAEMIAQLRDVAYGRNAAGEFKEPSARVREAALEALSRYETAASPTGQVSGVPAAHFGQSGGPGSAKDRDPGSFYVADNGEVRHADFQPTQPPVQPPTPPTGPPAGPPPGATTGPPSGATTGPTGGPTTNAPSPEAELPLGTFIGLAKVSEAPPGSPGAATVFNVPTQQPSVDTAQALSQNSAVNDVEVQRRSSVSFDPHVRGYRWGQIYTDADDAYWMPARLDMDTMLSKLDPGMIDSVDVIPGPYGVRFGPGFAFIDVNLLPAPRHDSFQADSDSTINVQSNGGQVYGRETVSGGGSDWGFRGGYGERDGSDYTAGDGEKMPSAYHSHDAWGEVGYDLKPHLHLNVSYQRLDETDTQIPGQFFDIAELTSYGFQTRIVSDDPMAPWTRLSLSGWYNCTVFRGDTAGNSLPTFPVIQRINYALGQEFAYELYDPMNKYYLSGFTNGCQYSAGARVGFVFGDKDALQLRTGADYRYIGQFIDESFTIDQMGPGVGPFGTGNAQGQFDTNMPQSYMIDPGVYAELSLPMTDLWTVSAGVRVDYAHTDASIGQLRMSGGLYAGSLTGLDANLDNDNILQRGNALTSFYLSNRYKLNEHWTLSGGFGEAERPPTLTERYADGVFISSLQTGFTNVIGDPQIKPERDWQIDVGLAAEYDNWRSRGNFFSAWVQDYITYTGQSAFIPPSEAFQDARLLFFTNTPLATLTGFDATQELDLNAYLTPFARMSYTAGYNQTIHVPLPGMSPLDSVLGLRIHDPDKGRHWGFETAVRMVPRQTQLGGIVENGTPTIVETTTAPFAVWNLRGYYNCTKDLSIVAGINNVLNTNYQEALDLRYQTLPGSGLGALKVLEPGFSTYCGVNWKY